ncbi:MAG TPA: DNA-directed RNA polymerase subunit K [Candidatus Paceibacterota bacterium]|nr:DNA-directed RNA polymerase subunit K [Candidatus Paceibacterota bacterium]
MEKEYTKYEITRILGARALQIAMDAPLLKDIEKEKLEKENYDPMEIAKEEFESGILPITVKQPMPKKKSVKLKKAVSVKETDKEVPEKDLEEMEEMEEKEIVEEGEIMELANPEDEEFGESEAGGREGSEELQ